MGTGWVRDISSQIQDPESSVTPLVWNTGDTDEGEVCGIRSESG